MNIAIKMYGYSYIDRIHKCSNEWQRHWSRYSSFSKSPVWPNAIPVFQKIERKKKDMVKSNTHQQR